MNEVMELIKQKENELRELKKQLKVITLSDSKFLYVLNRIMYKPFETDGCDCGNIEFELDENYTFELNRSCRKSSGCNNSYWEIDEPVLIVNRDYKDDEPLDYISICKEQADLLVKLATLKSYVELKESKNNSKRYSEEDFYRDLFEDVSKLFS